MEKLATEEFLDKLIEIFFHKFIFYFPSDVVTDTLIDQLDDDYDGRLIDTLLFIDSELGITDFNNDDVLELNNYLLEKRSLLQQNMFKLLDKSKELTEFEFLVIIEKYYEFLMLFIHISEKLTLNLKKCIGADVHLGIVGAFGIQLNFYIAHLKEICNYFGAFIDLDVEFDFSKQTIVLRYLPEIISRYVVISDVIIESQEREKLENNTEDLEKVPSKNSSKNKKIKLELNEKKIEAMILNQVFNVESQLLEQK